MSNIRADRDVFSFGNVTANNLVINSGEPIRRESAGGSKGRDVFCPSFYTPPNPSEVLLDFGLPLDDSQPLTPEAKVLRELLRGDMNDERTRIVSISGKAGVGKSCILRGLGVQEKLRERFPGGIYFISLGMDADESTLIQGLVEITRMCGGEELGRELRGEENLRIVVKKVREWMKGRKCLVLLDDCWERNGLGGAKVRELMEMFSTESGSALVMTTRFAELTTLGTVISIEEREAMSEEAQAILLRHAKFERKEIEEEEEVEAFYKVLKMCGGLPLFLGVVGRGVAQLSQGLKSEGSERKSVWRKYWEKLEAVGQGELLDTESDEYPDLSKTLQLSLELLSKRRGKRLGSLLKSKFSFQEMHRALCVFKKQARIPICVCRRLWNARNDGAALRIVEWFAGVGLADIETRRLGQKQVEYMRLHDLVHMFAVESVECEEGVARWHGRLLEGYASKGRSKKEVRKWWVVCKDICKNEKGDEYLLENVCRHLVSSGNVKELEGLLVCGEWSEFRHEAGGLSAWKADFQECLEGRKSECDRDGGIESEEAIERGLEMVRDAVAECWTYVDENPRELGFQVVGRLIDCENEVVRRYLKSVGEMQSGLWLRPLQRCWKRPGEGMMIGEFDLGTTLYDIALHKKSLKAVVGVGKEVAIINLKEMRVTARCAGHNSGIWAVGIGYGGKRAFSFSSDGTARQWDIESGEEHEERCIQQYNEEFTRDGSAQKCVVLSTENGFITMSLWQMIHVWDLGSGERVGRTMEASETVYAIAMSPDGQIVAAGIMTGPVLLFDVQTSWSLCGELKGHVDFVNRIAFSEDGRLLVSSSHDRTIRLWVVENKRQLGDPFVRCKGFPACVAFSDDSKQILFDSDGWIYVCDVASRAVIRSWRAHTRWANCLAVAGDVGGGLAVSGADGMLRVWDLRATPSEAKEHNYHKAAVSCVVASPDGSFFVSGSRDNTLRIWDGVDGRPLGEALCGHENGIEFVTMSPDSRRAVSVSCDYTMRLWDVETRAQIGETMQVHKDWINCVAFSLKGDFIVSGSDDQTLRVWRVIGYRENGGSASQPANKRMRVAGSGAHERWCNRESIRLEMTLPHEVAGEEQNPGRGVKCVAVSRDGQRVLSGLWNGEIWVWDMKSGRCIDRKDSQDDRSVVWMEISEENEVVTMNRQNEKSRWRLDKKGLMRILQSRDGPGIARSQEGSTIRDISDVVCRGRTVQLNCTGQKVATLPERVEPELWAYNAKHRVLCVGFRDGRVWFFRVES